LIYDQNVSDHLMLSVWYIK